MSNNKTDMEPLHEKSEFKTDDQKGGQKEELKGDQTSNDRVCTPRVDKKTCVQSERTMNPPACNEVPNLQDVFSNPFKGIHDLLASTLGTKLPKRKKKARFCDSEQEYSDDSVSDTSSDSSDDDEDKRCCLEMDNIPRWALLHQLLSSHNTLCTAYLKMIESED